MNEAILVQGTLTRNVPDVTAKDTPSSLRSSEIWTFQKGGKSDLSAFDYIHPHRASIVCNYLADFTNNKVALNSPTSLLPISRYKLHTTPHRSSTDRRLA